MRGEYIGFSFHPRCYQELPPRARRIPGYPNGWKHKFWNYLRVRGEYTIRDLRLALRQELPPRARRIHTTLTLSAATRGTTSACAENTNTDSRKNQATGNYLRVRGEYHPPPSRV